MRCASKCTQTERSKRESFLQVVDFCCFVWCLCLFHFVFVSEVFAWRPGDTVAHAIVREKRFLFCVSQSVKSGS